MTGKEVINRFVKNTGIIPAILSVILTSLAPLFAEDIINYRVETGVWAPWNDVYRHYLVLRSYTRKGIDHYLIVDPFTLYTEIVPTKHGLYYSMELEPAINRFTNSAYHRAMTSVKKNSRRIQNAGITRFLPAQKGINLTIDLCPSVRPLDRDIFLDLFKELNRGGCPVPVGIAVTGRWMVKHPDDLQWLKDMDSRAWLSIIWINHSFSHYYNRKYPLNKNFMLKPGTKIEREILLVEKMMIEKGLTPSVFFRFPGLVSNSRLVKAIMGYGLIPVGSDAWLGRLQWPKNGSIILIHGNGNEPIGIRRFIYLLKKKRKYIITKEWRLYDLRESAKEMLPE